MSGPYGGAGGFGQSENARGGIAQLRKLHMVAGNRRGMVMVDIGWRWSVRLALTVLAITCSTGAASAQMELLSQCESRAEPPSAAIPACSDMLSATGRSDFYYNRVMYARGIQYLRAKDYAHALADFTQVVSVARKSTRESTRGYESPAMYGAGLAKIGLGRSDEGQRDLHAAIAIDPQAGGAFDSDDIIRPAAMAAAPTPAPKAADAPAPAPMAGGNAELVGCVSIEKSPAHPFVNSCGFKVSITWCVLQPKAGAWSEGFDCEKNFGSLETIGANSFIGAHNSGGAMTYWYVCKFPATPYQVRYERGRGLIGTCR